MSPALQRPSPVAKGELPGTWFSPEAFAAERAERHRCGPFRSVTAFKLASILQDTLPPACIPVLTPSLTISTPAALSRAHRWEEHPGSPLHLPQLELLRFIL